MADDLKERGFQLHHVADPHAAASQQAIDQPARGNVAVEADERLAVEFA